MTALRPATLVGPISDQLFAVLAREQILGEADPIILQLKEDCDKLIKADAAAGYVCLAYVYQLCGDIDQAVHCAKNAQRLSSIRKFAGEMAEVCVLVNLGWFSRAAPLVKERITPKTGEFGSYWGLLLATGQLTPLTERYRDLPRMGIMQPQDFSPSILEAQPILSSAGISESSLARAFDAAGKVMREHRVTYHGTAPKLTITHLGGQPIVHFQFEVPLDGEQLGAANWELATELADADLIFDAMHVSFGAYQ